MDKIFDILKHKL